VFPVFTTLVTRWPLTLNSPRRDILGASSSWIEDQTVKFYVAGMLVTFVEDHVGHRRKSNFRLMARCGFSQQHDTILICTQRICYTVTFVLIVLFVSIVGNM
jgi:hypothetical protein